MRELLFISEIGGKACSHLSVLVIDRACDFTLGLLRLVGSCLLVRR